MITRYAIIRRSWIVGAFAIAIAAVMAATTFAFDDTLGKKAGEFRDSMRQRLDTVEGRLKSLKASVWTESEQAEKAVRENLEGARRKLEAQKEHVEKTRANLKARAQEKLSETKEAVNEWKAKRETQILNARADRAEASAADAIDSAAFAIEEADEAILDAMLARHDADAAKATAPVTP